MKIATMFQDITTSLFKQPITKLYPFERTEAPERYRGRLKWDAQKCIGCQLCVQDCPSEALEMIILDKKEKRYVLIYHLDRCTFCAQCTYGCRHGCLSMDATAWELADLNKNHFIHYFGDPNDIQQVLERGIAPHSTESECA